MPPLSRPEKPTKVKVRGWLKAHGHNAMKVDAVVDKHTTATVAILELHGVSVEEYRAARGAIDG